MALSLEFLNPYLQRWQALQPRERLVLLVGAAFLTFFLFYILLWRPVQLDIARLQKSLPTSQKQLAEMRVQSTQIKRLRSSRSSAGSSGNLLSAVEQASIARGLRQSITKLEPDSDNGIRMTIEQASFNALLSLIADLQRQNGLRIESASMDALENNPGVINAQIVLRGAKP